jgi:hypothetical protein
MAGGCSTFISFFFDLTGRFFAGGGADTCPTLNL